MPIASRREAACPSCHSSDTSLMPSAPRVQIFQPGWYEHIAHDPLYIETPEQLRAECEKNGGYSKQLEDSGIYKGSHGKLKEI